MSDHVTTDIADYIEGRLDADREQAVKAHLDACAECAADLALALQLQEYGAAKGMRHLGAERVATLASVPGAQMTELESEHLDECGLCRRDLELARTLPPDEAWEEIVPTPAVATRVARRTKPWFRGWKLLPAALAAAVAVVLLIIALPDREDFSDLARIEPLAVHISRGAVTPGSFESIRRQALESYRDGNYEDARDYFMKANESNPDAELQLYLGSVELLLGNAENAAATFEAIIKGQPRSAIREETIWQLANAYLASGQPEQAKKTLQEVITAGGTHEGDARALLEKLMP